MLGRGRRGRVHFLRLLLCAREATSPLVAQAAWQLLKRLPTNRHIASVLWEGVRGGFGGGLAGGAGGGVGTGGTVVVSHDAPRLPGVSGSIPKKCRTPPVLLARRSEAALTGPGFMREFKCDPSDLLPILGAKPLLSILRPRISWRPLRFLLAALVKPVSPSERAS